MNVRGWLAIDVEVGQNGLLSLAVADPDGKEVFAQAWRTADVPTWVKDVIADPGIGLIEHTLFDARQLTLEGWDVQGPIADTRVMSWNVNENESHRLEDCAARFLGRTMDKRLSESGRKFRCDDGTLVPLDEAPWDQLRRYNVDDAVVAALLFSHLEPLMPEYWPNQVALTSVLLDMETAGVRIDMDRLTDLRDELGTKHEHLRKVLTDGLPSTFNLGSKDQVAALLFLKEFELPGRYRKGEEPDDLKVTKEGRLYVYGTHDVKGYGLRAGQWTDSESRPKVDSKNLARHAGHPWVSQYLAYEKLDKVIGTYLDALPHFCRVDPNDEYGGYRLYGRFNQGGTVTGRLSSSDPNLQNIPRRGEIGGMVRELFVGDLIIADFSQLEPRIAAHCSEDPELLRVYQEGLDVYKDLGSYVFDVVYDAVDARQREVCKTLILGMNYGAQSRTVAEQLSLAGFPTRPGEAKVYLTRTQEKYARFFEWREEVIKEAYVNGFIRTLAGRKRHLTFEGDTWRVERQAVNSKIQGSAADIVDATLLLIAQIPGVRPLLQVHDEIVAEYEQRDQALLRRIQDAGETGHGYHLRVPLVFEPKFAETWGEK